MIINNKDNIHNIMAKATPDPISRKPITIRPSERPIVDALRIYTPVSESDEEPLIELSDKIKEVAAAVRRTGNNGEVKMVIKLSGQGKNIAMQIECTAKVPKSKPAKRLVFAADNGEIVTHDPDQYEFIDQLQRPDVPAAEKATAA